MNYSGYSFNFGEIDVEKYERLIKIGEGANGEVYTAKRKDDEAIVAIKYLNYSDSKSGKRFENEIEIYRKLWNCPFIVKILDYSLYSFKPYLVMEFCQYGNARNQMNFFVSNHSLGIGLLLGIAEGIRQIHSLGSYHRDVKPDNLLLTTDASGNYILKLGDAGMSCFIADSNFYRNATYSLQGTPNYIAPELLRGESFSAAADVFSFGVTCHELLTGVRPYAGQQITRGPVEMRNLIEKMISDDPINRPTVEQVISEMKAVFSQLKSKQIGADFMSGLFKAGTILGGIVLGVKILDELLGND